MTKRQRAIVNSYYKSTITELGECYHTFSERKRQAYKDCLHQYLEDDGQYFRIVSYNTSIFTVGYTIDNGTKLVYITPTKKEVIEISPR